MTLPISIDQLKLALSFLPLEPEVKKSLITNCEILIEIGRASCRERVYVLV